MHVLMLTTHLDTGGITSYILTLSKGLVKSGCRVTVVSGGGSKQSAFEAAGVRVLDMNIRTKSELNPRLYWPLGRLKRLIREEKVEIIHAHTRVTQVMGWLLGKLAKIPYVATCHGFYKPRWSRRVLPCWGNNVIAISPAVSEHLEHDFGVDRKRIFQIKHGINVEEFPLVNTESRRRQRGRYNITGSPVIGIIARLADVKGHDVLIRAMPEIFAGHVKAELIIVGEGKHEPVLRQMVDDLNLKDRIQFFPVTDRTTEFLPAFDVFVMPSLSEGFGLSMIEAMAVGVPVVATRVGGIPSFIRQDQTGLLIEPSNSRDLAQAVCRMLDDKPLAERITRDARQLIEKEYSAEQMVQRTREVYRQTHERYSGC